MESQKYQYFRTQAKKSFKVQDFLAEKIVYCSSFFNAVYYVTHTLNVFFSISGI